MIDAVVYNVLLIKLQVMRICKCMHCKMYINLCSERFTHDAAVIHPLGALDPLHRSRLV